MTEGSWRSALRGIWLPAVGVVAYSAACNLSLYFMRRFGFPSDHPGSNPPWYFIRNDYLEGLTMFGMGTLCIVLGLFFLRRHPIFGGMLAWQSVTTFGGSAWQAFVIILRSDNVMDPVLAETQWATFDAYLADPMRAYGRILTLLLALVILFASILLERKRAASLGLSPAAQS